MGIAAPDLLKPDGKPKVGRGLGEAGNTMENKKLKVKG